MIGPAVRHTNKRLWKDFSAGVYLCNFIQRKLVWRPQPMTNGNDCPPKLFHLASLFYECLRFAFPKMTPGSCFQVHISREAKNRIGLRLPFLVKFTILYCPFQFFMVVLQDRYSCAFPTDLTKQNSFWTTVHFALSVNISCNVTEGSKTTLRKSFVNGFVLWKERGKRERSAPLMSVFWPVTRMFWPLPGLRICLRDVFLWPRLAFSASLCPHVSLQLKAKRQYLTFHS